MKTAKKISIIIAIALIVGGLIISFVAFAMTGFDDTKLNTMEFITQTYTIEDVFSNIHVEGVECNVRFASTDKDLCSISCNESDKIYHQVAVKDGTLIVKRVDNRKWYERIGIYLGNMEITVFLPDNEYGKLFVKTMSGSIELPDGFTFAQAEMESLSGDVNVSADVQDQLSVETKSGKVQLTGAAAKSIVAQSVSGDVTLSSVEAQEDIEVKSTSGKIQLSDVGCRVLSSDNTSGSSKFNNVIAREHMEAVSVSGSIKLGNCDGHTLYLKSISGSITGTLLREKQFLAHTISGNIQIPASGTGGTCQLETTSGNIKIQIAENQK